VSLQLEFLGLQSNPSPLIPSSAIVTVQPINYSSYLRLNADLSVLLSDEIQSEGEYLSFRINLIEKDKEGVVAQGSVALWVMIEDSCNILRQEVDLFDPATEEVVGFAVLDVRGHRFLKECS
jgi:hypothetical protein